VPIEEKEEEEEEEEVYRNPQVQLYISLFIRFVFYTAPLNLNRKCEDKI
jgi:hypothetical protein